MKRMVSSLIFVVSVLMLLCDLSLAQDRTIRRQDAPAGASSGAERRVALVIGNGAYKSAPLRNPPNDAKDMAAALRGLGFEVIEKLDADKRVMEEALEEFYRKLLRAEIGLFYYSGHGVQVESTNYLVPVGVPITSESDVRYGALNAGRVLGKMKDAGNSLNIVVLDACRDNPFERSFRSSSLGLAQMEAPTGTIVAYATAPGSVAGEGPGRNGIFTKHLLENLKTPGLSLQDLFNETGLAVMKETQRKQVPWVSSTPVARYALAGGAAQSAPVARPEPAPTSPKPSTTAPVPQKEEPQIASISSKPQQTPAPASSYGEEVGRDGVYIAYANGIVKDTKTRLEWVAGPDRHMEPSEAETWVESLNVGGGGWRMPTVKELKGLYQYGKGSRNMTPLLKTTGWVVWVSGPSKLGFDFSSGFEESFRWSYNGKRMQSRSRTLQADKDVVGGFFVTPYKSKFGVTEGKIFLTGDGGGGRPVYPHYFRAFAVRSLSSG